ncbi:MAG: stage III sporulation protein AF [Cellulosilyticaceae bacterium]
MREYLQVLIWTMLFVVMVEMVFPSSDLKKYLKLVLGFIVVYTIASPIIGIVSQVNQKDTFGGYLMYYQKMLGTQVAYSEFEEEQKRQQEGLRDVYETQITSQVKQILEKKLPIDVRQVDVEMSQDPMDFSVQEVALTITLKEEEGGSIKVPKVKIGEKTESLALNDEHLKEEVKKCLKDFYNWDNINIHITVQHK